MNRILFSFLILSVLSINNFPQSAAEIISDGMRAFNNQDYVEANSFFDQFFDNYSEIDELYSTAKYFAGESLLNLGEKHAAKERFEFLVNNYQWSTFRDAALYKLGLIYFDTRDFSQARNRWTVLISEYPESQYFGPALYWIGESYFEEGEFENSIKLLEDAVSKRKENKFIDYSIYTLANVYERKGDYQNALKYYDELLSFYKDSKFAPIAQFRIGYCYFKLKEYQSAIIELNNPVVTNLEPNIRSEALYLLAHSHYRISEFRLAENIFRKLQFEYPDSDLRRSVQYALAWCLFQQERYADAYEMFDTLSEIEDSIGIYSFYWKAESNRYAGNLTESLEIFKEFVKKFPGTDLADYAKFQTGNIYYTDYNFNASERYLLETMQSGDAFLKSKAYVMLGEMRLRKDDYLAANENFNSALIFADTKSEFHSAALLGLGVSFYKLKQYSEAVKNLTNLELTDPNFNPDKVNFYLAESYYAKGNFSEAVKRYNYVNKDEKDLSSLAQYGKGYAYFYLKDYENAILSFNNFIKKSSNDTRTLDARLRLADSYYGNKNYISAAKIYKDIFLSGEETAKNPYVQYQYAQALYKGGNSPEAISQFRILQSSFPQSEYADKALYIVGWIFFQQNSYYNAIDGYRVLLNTYPNSSLNPIVFYSIGDAFFNLGKYDSAIVNYQKVIDQYPNSNYVFDAINGIQYCYVAQNREDKAISLIDEFVRKNSALSFSDQIFFKKGEIYYSQGLYEKARSSYVEFTSKFPKSELTPSAYYWMGKCSQNLGRAEEAIFNFNKVFESYPNSELAAASVIEIGNIYNQNKKYDLALNILNKGSEKLSNSPQIAEILFMKAATMLNIGDVNSAYDVFNDIAQYYGETVFADRSKLEVGLIEYSAKRYDNAITYLSSISDSRTDEIGAKAQFYIGMSFFDQGKINEAISSFVRMRTIYSYYDEWLARSNLMLGDCYKNLNDKEKAKQFYRDVLAKHRGDEFGKFAQKKLREIE